MSGTKRPKFRKWANQLTDKRPELVDAICRDAEKAGQDFRSVALAGRLTLALATDKADGLLAGLSNIPDPEYAVKDRDFDKKAVYKLYATLAKITADSRYLVYLGLNATRDQRVDATRASLIDLGHSGNARSWGKWKMTAQSAALVADFSPLGNSHPGQVHGLHMLAAGLTVVSGLDIELNARQTLKYANLSSEDEIEIAKMVEAYTTPEPSPVTHQVDSLLVNPSEPQHFALHSSN